MAMPIAASPMETSMATLLAESVKYRALAAIVWMSSIPAVQPRSSATWYSGGTSGGSSPRR
jgi:hypothetical protein